MPKQSAIAQAIDFLKTNWFDGKSLKEIAHHHRVDAGNLERAFRKQEGVTVKQFLDAKRKEHVLARLADKEFLGYAIGAELGFGNDLAFYRWVKRAFGVSFAELRSRCSGDRKPVRSTKTIK